VRRVRSRNLALAGLMALVAAAALGSLLALLLTELAAI
jgi:hypothetical protein